jgi:hypothetical protein
LEGVTAPKNFPIFSDEERLGNRFYSKRPVETAAAVGCNGIVHRLFFSKLGDCALVFVCETEDNEPFAAELPVEFVEARD